MLFYCSFVSDWVFALIAGNGGSPHWREFEYWNSFGLYLPCTMDVHWPWHLITSSVPIDFAEKKDIFCSSDSGFALIDTLVLGNIRAACPSVPQDAQKVLLYRRNSCVFMNVHIGKVVAFFVQSFPLLL